MLLSDAWQEIENAIREVAYRLEPFDLSVISLRLGLDRQGEPRSALESSIALEVPIEIIFASEARCLAVVRSR